MKIAYNVFLYKSIEAIEFIEAYIIICLVFFDKTI